ncbi:type VII secretion-associated serine protease mycosin [Actinoplanes sp. NEAU-A11]|uniref:Type VII secretion-associated serine protease mycosin n=2 Tax=Actinoplanes aureus TaxID=2792083 RepID=A0A931C710_9ACTN|nr:type VII secretion-associated serine protease mycosin [Actinoplanes aureus]
MIIAPGNSARADNTRAAQWFLEYLNIDQAHQISTGTGITVGVPDSGTSRHRDLEKNLVPGTDLLADGGGTGQTDSSGHGTHMAGAIAGHGHGAKEGVLGVAPAAKILPIRTSSADEGGTDLAVGIEWAASHGAEVINVSAAAPQSLSINRAVSAAGRSDSVIVAAAGNTTQSTLLGYPAAIPDVLAVGAIERTGQHADFSVTGPEVDICAPGSEIVTTALNNRYIKTAGTSVATAIVSGAAALVRSKFPDLSAKEVIYRLTFTATDIGPPGRDDECGFGVLNVVKALTADVPPATSNANPSARSSETATPSASKDVAAPPRPEKGGTALVAVLGGGGAIIAIGTLLAFLVSRRRRPQGPPGVH